MVTKSVDQEEEIDGFLDRFLSMIEGGREGLCVRFNGKIRILSELPEAVALAAIEDAVKNRRLLFRVI